MACRLAPDLSDHKVVVDILSSDFVLMHDSR